MKRYATTYSNGHTAQTSLAHEANNIQNFDDAQAFFLSGKPVTAQEFYAAAQQAINAKLAKKEQTHKKVRVLHGSSAGSYVYKWVPLYNPEFLGAQPPRAGQDY
jgi:hypothetical protein